MLIHSHFTGGNIHVLKTEGSTVYVQNEIRDTMEDWFYWAFCVEGAQGETLTFIFDKRWIGYYGPAVSHDLNSWNWLYSTPTSTATDRFSYTFGEDETCIYFAHNMLYHPSHFEHFCMKLNLPISTLCISEKGREIPYIRLGNGNETILLTARHHACEATGSYVLEGLIRELAAHPIPDTQVIAVPFVDYDGVVDGDQGKSRAPHDHNRDYVPDEEAIYASVREIRKISAENKLRYAFDFHSPWHIGNQNDWVFIPQINFDNIKNVTLFQCFLEKAITPDSLPYSPDGTYMPDEGWNKIGTPSFGTYMRNSAGAELSFSFETPYFKALRVPYAGAEGAVAFSASGARELGRCFALALHSYHNRKTKIAFTGGLLYDQALNRSCKTSQGYDYLQPFKGIWGRLANADYLVGNAETNFCDEENATYTNAYQSFSAPNEALVALRNSGFDLLSLVNNHCMDRGQNGILATLDACDHVGLEHIGLYRTKAERRTAFVREINGIHVGFVNATYGTNVFAHHRFLDQKAGYMVSMTQPEETLDGAINLLQDMEEIKRQTNTLYGDKQVSSLVAPYLVNLKTDIQRTKAQSDFVVMLLRSGSDSEPDAYTQMLVEKIREYGADLIVCSHPHIIQSSALENGFFTAYSLGNLLCSEDSFSRTEHSINPDYSAILNLTLEKGEDGKIKQHLSFHLCQTLRDPEHKRSPRIVDTYDQWRKAPNDSYKDTILYYANRFMPGMNYTEVMPEYPIY